MPSIITFSELRNINKDILHESSELLKAAFFSVETKNVFLSYSSKDSEYLPSIIKILKNHGGNPYVDKGDDRLPNPPSVETAQVLKDSIKKCRRMVVFVTTNSKESKWIPWELGLADGSKSNYDIALFPSAEKSYESQWTEQEYLGLYRRIVWGSMEGYTDQIWIVYNYHNNTATPLVNWLKN